VTDLVFGSRLKTALVAASAEVTRIKVGRRSDRSRTKSKA
jgi:hypothetical protein